MKQLLNAKARFEDELKQQGKPEKIWANIIPGKIEDILLIILN